MGNLAIPNCVRNSLSLPIFIGYMDTFNCRLVEIINTLEKAHLTILIDTILKPCYIKDNSGNFVRILNKGIDTMQTFHTVGELIDYLETLGRKRSLITVYYEHPGLLNSDDIRVWNPADANSPVAFIVEE